MRGRPHRQWAGTDGHSYYARHTGKICHLYQCQLICMERNVWYDHEKSTYKQRLAGSIPSTPTKPGIKMIPGFFCYYNKDGLLFAAFKKNFFMYNDANEQNDNKNQQHVPQPDQIVSSDTEKDREDWVTGTEPMTGVEKSYLKKKSDEGGEDFDENISKATASTRIDKLEDKTRKEESSEKE